MTIQTNYLSISDSEATPASTWFTQFSTDTGNNTGWTFQPDPRKQILVSYLSIKDSAAAGDADWLAPTNYGNVDAGNDTGWVFTKASLRKDFTPFLAVPTPIA
jgi:hypothetical protein